MSEHLNAAEFHAKDERRWSPEWDFGVMWSEHESNTHSWPFWRVSWIVNTGELYAQRSIGNRVHLLGVVPPVGDYPHGSHEMWTAFKNAQDIEKVMDGWAEGEPHKPLSWIEERLAAGGFTS